MARCKYWPQAGWPFGPVAAVDLVAMATRIPALRVPPIGFAHRGASAHAQENTLEAFALAKKLGATGLESDVWVTKDGVAVLDHDGVVRKRLVQRQPIRELLRAELPAHIPSLAEFYSEVGIDMPLSLDICDRMAFEPVIADAEKAGAVENLWLCYRDSDELVSWRERAQGAQLVHSTKLAAMTDGPERHASRLAAAKIDAVNMRNTEWSGGTMTMFHRFGVLAFSWDCQHLRVIREAIDMGADGFFSDHSDRIADGLASFGWPAAES